MGWNMLVRHDVLKSEQWKYNAYLARKIVWYHERKWPLQNEFHTTVTDKPPSPSDPKKPAARPDLRSPIRPRQPEPNPDDQQPASDASESKNEAESLTSPKNPGLALDALRKKMETVASEFAAGRINRAQFNAIYGRYDEQRTIIERLLERNPDSDAWKQVVRSGHTSFLRDHFEARCMYYLVYRYQTPTPLTMGGHQQPDMDQIEPVLTAVYNMQNRPENGLARKDLGGGQWLVVALGNHALTIVMFNLEPSASQLNRVRDLHNDFERANRSALERGTRTLEKMVFPQRALVEQS
jgi:hypothetical protein